MAEKENGPKIVAGVRFHRVGKIYHFDASDYPDLCGGDFVVVTTNRGQQLGQVASVELPDKVKVHGTLKPVDRRATGRDLAVRKHWENKELEALITARELNAEVGLTIKLVKAEYSFDGKQLVFLYSAEDRKDIKPLRKRLSRAFRARVELRQIGPRDVAKVMGGYGACGEARCCAVFLTDFSPISIRMAKAQGISLSPSEITGMCGRLRCCLVYEYEQYAAARKNLPKKGKRIGTPHGEGKVISLFPLKETALVDLGEKRVEVQREEIVPLEEWRALQERAAAPGDHVESRTRTAPSSQSQEAEAEPRSLKARAQSRRSGARNNAEPEPTEPEKKRKTKSSRRHRRRRR